MQGAIRSYAVGLDGDRLCIRKNDNGLRLLAETECPVPAGSKVTLTVTARGNQLTVCCGEISLSCRDTDRPWLRGAVGVAVRDGSTALVESIRVKGLTD